MPPEGLDWLPKLEVLTDEEIVRLVRIGVEQLGRHARSGSPAASRCCGPAWSASSPRAAALRPRPEVASPPTRSGWPASRRRSPPPASTGSTVSLDTRRPGAVHAAHPPRPAGRRARRPAAAAGRRADAGQGQRGADARHQRGRAPSAARLLPRARLPAAVHRADAAGRPARLGPRAEMVTAEDILERLSAAPHARPRTPSRAGRRPPRRWLVDGGPGARSASSPRSPGRSAGPATGPGSPPTARSATACSRARSPTCGRRCATGATRRGAGRPLADRHAGRSCPATASTTRASCSRPGRCRRSAGERWRTRHRALFRRCPGGVRRGHRDGAAPDARSTNWWRSWPPRTERLERVLTACSFLVDGAPPPATGVALTPVRGRRAAAVRRRLIRVVTAADRLDHRRGSPDPTRRRRRPPGHGRGSPVSVAPPRRGS